VLPLALQALAQTSTNTEWLREELSECLHTLHDCMNAISVFARNNRSVSQELLLEGCDQLAEEKEKMYVALPSIVPHTCSDRECVCVCMYWSNALFSFDLPAVLTISAAYILSTIMLLLTQMPHTLPLLVQMWNATSPINSNCYSRGKLIAVPLATAADKTPSVTHETYSCLGQMCMHTIQQTEMRRERTRGLRTRYCTTLPCMRVLALGVGTLSLTRISCLVCVARRTFSPLNSLRQ
jgi:deoxycytidylate deaminase